MMNRRSMENNTSVDQQFQIHYGDNDTPHIVYQGTATAQAQHPHQQQHPSLSHGSIGGPIPLQEGQAVAYHHQHHPQQHQRSSTRQGAASKAGYGGTTSTTAMSYGGGGMGQGYGVSADGMPFRRYSLSVNPNAASAGMTGASASALEQQQQQSLVHHSAMLAEHEQQQQQQQSLLLDQTLPTAMSYRGSQQQQQPQHSHLYHQESGFSGGMAGATSYPSTAELSPSLTHQRMPPMGFMSFPSGGLMLGSAATTSASGTTNTHAATTTTTNNNTNSNSAFLSDQLAGGGTGDFFSPYTMPVGAATAAAAAAVAAAAATSHGMTQAEKEEELLLNLLIKRRQRSMATGGNQASNIESLADELVRLRQGRAAMTGASASHGALPDLFSREHHSYRQQQQYQQQQQQQQLQLHHHSSQSHHQQGLPSHLTGFTAAGSSNSSSTSQPSFAAMMNRHSAAVVDSVGLNANVSTLTPIEMSGRIDRQPAKLVDARVPGQDGIDLSGRSIVTGGKRGYGGGGMGSGSSGSLDYYKYATTAGMDPLLYGAHIIHQHGLLNPPPATKKPRVHKKKPADMPRRPLSAYNLFFSEERERILKQIDGDGTVGMTAEGEEELPEPRENDEDETKELGESIRGDDVDESTGNKPPKALLRPLIPSQKKRRPHRKTHGKISFQELARMVGERWKTLPAERRKYYQDLAQEDMRRQKVAMEEYFAKQKAKEGGGSLEKQHSEVRGTSDLSVSGRNTPGEQEESKISSPEVSSA